LTLTLVSYQTIFVLVHHSCVW